MTETAIPGGGADAAPPGEGPPNAATARSAAGRADPADGGAYEDDPPRCLAAELDWCLIRPPKRAWRELWQHDRPLYRRRRGVERIFRRLERFRRIAAYYDKLDAVFSAFIHLVLALDSLLKSELRRLGIIIAGLNIAAQSGGLSEDLARSIIYGALGVESADDAV